jgi:hypothetical protein
MLEDTVKKKRGEEKRRKEADGFAVASLGRASPSSSKALQECKDAGRFKKLGEKMWEQQQQHMHRTVLLGNFAVPSNDCDQRTR